MNNFGYEIGQAYTYAAVVSVVTIHSILIIISIYYFAEDCRKVFCDKRNRVEQAINANNVNENNENIIVIAT